jgi:hypothetical protein
MTTGGGTQHIRVDVPVVDETGVLLNTAPTELMERILPDLDVPEYEIAQPVAEVVEAPASLANLAALAKSVGMTLVPSGAAMPMEMTQALPALPEEEEDETSTEAGLPGPMPLPPIETQQQLTVLGAPVVAPTVVQSTVPTMLPVMTQQAAMNAATGQTVVVDTSPRALSMEGLIVEDVGAGGVNAGFNPQPLRARRPRPAVRFEEPTVSAPPTASAQGPVTIVKLGQ